MHEKGYVVDYIANTQVAHILEVLDRIGRPLGYLKMPLRFPRFRVEIVLVRRTGMCALVPSILDRHGKQVFSKKQPNETAAPKRDRLGKAGHGIRGIPHPHPSNS